MKFFIISSDGDGVGLALRLQDEGHDVSIWVQNDKAAKRGSGLLARATPDSITQDTVVIADVTGSGAICDAIAESGVAVIGGSAVADKLEKDRRYAEAVMRETGIKTPKTKYFTDWASAHAFVEKSDARLVFKPEGELSGVVPSYVSSDQEDMLEMLDVYAAASTKSVPSFALQEFIEGTCVSTECWFNGFDFVLPFNHTIERKQLMNGDIGPSGGCTGNVVWSCDDEDCPVCDATAAKMGEFLSSVRFCGPIDVNAVVSEGGVFGLEFTPRFGYDAMPTLLCSLLDQPIGELLDGVARASIDEMSLRSGFAAGIRVTVPPWPLEEEHKSTGLPLRGLRKFDSFYPYDVMKSIEGNLCTSGGFNITGVALGYGGSIEESFSEARRIADKLRLPNKQYRTDLADVCKADMRRLNRYTKAAA